MLLFQFPEFSYTFPLQVSLVTAYTCKPCKMRIGKMYRRWLDVHLHIQSFMTYGSILSLQGIGTNKVTDFTNYYHIFLLLSSLHHKMEASTPFFLLANEVCPIYCHSSEIAYGRPWKPVQKCAMKYIYPTRKPTMFEFLTPNSALIWPQVGQK